MIETRLLTPDDAEAYWAIRLEALEEVPRAFSASAEKHRASQPKDMVERLRFVENGAFIVGAFDAGKLIGTAGVWWPNGGDARPFVVGMYVAPEHRGQGVASHLLETVLDRVRSYGRHNEIALDCFGSSVGALALYRRFGFETVYLEPGVVSIGDEYVDLHHMLLDLR